MSQLSCTTTRAGLSVRVDDAGAALNVLAARGGSSQKSHESAVASTQSPVASCSRSRTWRRRRRSGRSSSWRQRQRADARRLTVADIARSAVAIHVAKPRQKRPPSGRIGVRDARESDPPQVLATSGSQSLTQARRSPRRQRTYLPLPCRWSRRCSPRAHAAGESELVLVQTEAADAVAVSSSQGAPFAPCWARTDRPRRRCHPGPRRRCRPGPRHRCRRSGSRRPGARRRCRRSGCCRPGGSTARRAGPAVPAALAVVARAAALPPVALVSSPQAAASANTKQVVQLARVNDGTQS